MIGKTILYTGRCRKNATVSESFDCQEEEIRATTILKLKKIDLNDKIVT